MAPVAAHVAPVSPPVAAPLAPAAPVAPVAAAPPSGLFLASSWPRGDTAATGGATAT